MNNIVNRYRISIDTFTAVKNFLEQVSGLENHIRLIGDDDNGNCVVSGNSFLKSVISTLHTMSFKNLWLESDIEIYSKIKDFVINESK